MSKDKQSICVTVRVRPLSNKELEEDTRICLKVDQCANMISIIGPNSQRETKDFYFDSVCDKIGQNQIFEKVGRRSTLYCMEGYNCTIFAYGQTGAGKTYTMMGINPQSRDYYQQRGLIPRTLEHLFDCIEKQINEVGVDYIIKCSFIEIYNEQIIDLLGNGSNSLNIREDLKKGVHIQGVYQQIISQSNQAMQILRKGSKGRHVGSTYYNETSSRSHSVFTMQIESQQVSNGIKSTKSRHFHFIDLAGSERTKKSIGDRLKEGCSINKSLHVLSMVISSLAEVSQGKARHVNYRDSKLTFLLKDSLGGNSKTHLIANISPSYMSSLETKSTLMFARKVKLIKVNKVSINQDASGNLQALKAEIRRLRSQNLLLKNGNISIPSSVSTSYPMLGINNSKMVVVLQQYIDEQLQKQTQLQLQITKLVNKNSYLQRGVTQFNENQKQYKLILAIYEDKIKKLKNAQKLLLKQVEQLSSNDKIQEIKDYFQSERQHLLEEVDRFKKISQSASLVKNLLRQAKAIRESEQSYSQQQNLIAALTKNNQFLQQVKNSITEMEPEGMEGKNSKVMGKENEELRIRNEELSQKVEKYALELAETKDKYEESETLLGEAISAQISTEKKMEKEVAVCREELEKGQLKYAQMKQAYEKVELELKNQMAKYDEVGLVSSQYELEISKLKSQLLAVKDKKEYDEVNLREKIEYLGNENSRLEQTVRRKGEEIQRLKSDNYQIKSELEKAKEDTQSMTIDTTNKLQQLQKSLLRGQNDRIQQKSKLQKQLSSIQQKLCDSKQQNKKLFQKYSILITDLKICQQQLSKQLQISAGWKQKYQLNIRSYQQEKRKWEQNQNELVKMINEKKVSDSETQAKFTESQLEIINLNEKNTELSIQYKSTLESLKFVEVAAKAKGVELEQQVQMRERELEEVKMENGEYKKKVLTFSETELSLRRQIKLLQEDVLFRQEEQVKANEELEKIKKKEKQSRIAMNEIKNQIYAMKKNYEVELESAREELRGKEDEIQTLERESANIKLNYEKSLSELQRKTESQYEIYKQNQGSIKRAMEAHLMNKEKRANELKAANQLLQIELEQNISALKDTKEKLQSAKVQYQKLSTQKKSMTKQITQLQQKHRKNQQIMNTIQNDHIKTVEQMQNNFNQELDYKNAEIEKLRRGNESLVEQVGRMGKLEEELNHAKSELINRQTNYQMLEKIVQGRERELKVVEEEMSMKIMELQSEIKTNQRLYEEGLAVEQLNVQKVNDECKEKQGMITKLNQMIKGYQGEVENLQKENGRLEQEKLQNMSNQSQMLEQNQKQFERIRRALDTVQKQNQQMRNKISMSNLYIQALETDLNTAVGANLQFKNVIKQLKDQVTNLVSGNQQLRKEVKNLDDEKCGLENSKNQMNIVLERKQKQIENLEMYLSGAQKKARTQQQKFNNLLQRTHQQSTQKINRLNALYQQTQSELEQLRKKSERVEETENLMKEAYEIKIQQLVNQIKYQDEVIGRREEEIASEKQKQVELSRYIDEQSQKMNSLTQSKQKLSQQLQILKKDTQKKVKQSQKRLYLADTQMNSLKQQLKLIQDEATVWKQRMDSLQSEIRLSNDRAEKFRVEYMKEKESNKQLKLLLDNAHCQIESFKNQVIDKDKLYHQLLEKVSKNDIERKGLMNQDKKFSDLLQKSRIEVSQLRQLSIQLSRKYDDQLKINNILKQQVQKKQVDVSLVKQRSEQYCRKQQQLLEQIKNDYAKVETQLKTTQQCLIENKKLLKKTSLKNQELEEKNFQLNRECIDAQNHNEELKKESLRSGIDERQTNYVNRVKQQNTQLRRQLQKASQTIVQLNQQKLRLKSQIRNGKDTDMQNLQLSRKISQVKYLQKIIDDSITVLGFKDCKKSLGESLKTGIIELQRELARAKSELMQLHDDMSLKNQRIQLLEGQKFKSGGLGRQEDDTLTKVRNKINKTSSTMEAFRQSKEEDKMILQLKDSNKGLWGIGKC